MDIQEMVDKNQYRKPMLTKEEVLKSMQREMKQVRPEPATCLIFDKSIFPEELAEDLRKDGLEVKDYEDVHSPLPQIKVDWSKFVK